MLSVGATGLVTVPYAFAAEASSPADDELQEVLVSGFRMSLQLSTEAKLESVGFSDSIFAQDMGKFPDTNIAESLNRVPGITIVRDINGVGANVAIRGLGSSFTSVVLNNTPIAVGSTGRTGATGTNREVDLTIFPTELFTQLTVNKSARASMLEGGAAGSVNLRSARPFDREGFNARYSLEGQDGLAGSLGTHGSVMVSNTWGKFGALAGVSIANDETRIRGYESVGWTNPNLLTSGASIQCTTGCNSTGGGNWTIPATVPANAGNGLNAGDAINQAFLLAHNPGLTIQQLDNGIMPRLNRPVDDFGEEGRRNAIVSLEYRPTDDLRFYLDSMYGRKTQDLERIDINWVGRNGGAIPLNVKVDRADCSAGCTVTEGTYANAQFFLEYRPWIEKTRHWGFNPGMSWQIADNLKLDVQANGSHSTHRRETPTVLPITAPSSGVTVTFNNTAASHIPVVTTNIDLNDPANFRWTGGRVNIQDETRFTSTKGSRFDLTWGDEKLNMVFGAAYDDVSRKIRAFDNSQAWQNSVCGDNPNVFVPGPNAQPPCEGLNQTGAAPTGYPTYPALGTGYTAGYTTPLTYRGSLVPTAALPGYLQAGPSGFVTLDWEAFKDATNYDVFHDAAPETGSSNSSASGGYVREKVTGAYAELNGKIDLLGSLLRYNVGVRYVHTDQTIGGRVSIADPRNPTAPPTAVAAAQGSLYPNIVNFAYTNTKYNNWLPAVNLAYNITDHAVFRLAMSRTMTRANPNSMLPGLNFSSQSADVGTVGNPAVDPYLSSNIDLGFELYTGGPGYVSFTAFRKNLDGFTVNGNTTVPFSSLAAYGVNYSTLNATQQGAIDSRGGPSNATVVLTQQVNAPGKLTVNGLEIGWVQPLDFVLEKVGLTGFGFSANTTIIDQKGSGAAPAIATGVAPRTYNSSLWYEQHGISARISYNYAKGSQSTGANQSGIAAAAIYGDPSRQWDFSSSLQLGNLLNANSAFWPELTLDVINLTKEKQRSYFQFSNATNDFYNPGRTILFGVRGKF
jgi:TonB-dependent receptor